MNVQFTLGPLNVETMDNNGYRDLIETLRGQLGVRFSHNRPVLAFQHNPPTLFFDLILRTNNRSVRFRFRSDNLSLLGYVPVDENNNPLTQWLEFDPRNRPGQDDHIIKEPGTNFLGFEASYHAIANAADQSIEEMTVGFRRLVAAIDQLAVVRQVRKIRARSLVVVIMMISEATRLIPVFNYMAQSFDNNPGILVVQPWITELVHAWHAMSAALLRADAFPGQPFQFPQNVPIGTIEQATEVLGILLGLRFNEQ